jgi:IS6 family transposase
MSDFKGQHFNGAVILWAVRWYCKYGISYRELAEMLDERGIQVNCRAPRFCRSFYQIIG